MTGNRRAGEWTHHTVICAMQGKFHWLWGPCAPKNQSCMNVCHVSTQKKTNLQHYNQVGSNTCNVGVDLIKAQS